MFFFLNKIFTYFFESYKIILIIFISCVYFNQCGCILGVIKLLHDNNELGDICISPYYPKKWYTRHFKAIHLQFYTPLYFKWTHMHLIQNCERDSPVFRRFHFVC